MMRVLIQSAPWQDIVENGHSFSQKTLLKALRELRHSRLKRDPTQSFEAIAGWFDDDNEAKYSPA